MPSDQTPHQPQAFQPDDPPAGARYGDVSHEGEFSQALAGESGDPIWESSPPQPDAGRAERARRAVREPEGRLPPGRIIDLVQGQRPG